MQHSGIQIFQAGGGACLEYCQIKVKWITYALSKSKLILSSDNSVVRTVSQRGVLFRHTLSPIGSNAIFCCNYWDVFPSIIGKINKQFVWQVHQQRVIIPEFNKINVIKELLHVKYNFATVPCA